MVKLETFLFVHSPSNTNDIDGIEAIGMLTSLTQFTDAYKSSFSETNNNENNTIIMDNKDIIINRILTSLNASLNSRINIFINEQINWINNQKGDPKAPEVLSPYARFPNFISQVLELCNGMVN